MPEFVIRAHGASTDPQKFLASTGEGAHVEYLAQIVVSALLISKGHRDDTILHLVIEESADYSRCVTFDGANLGQLGGTTESALLALIASALRQGQGLAKEAECVTAEGLRVQAISFERLIKLLQTNRAVYLLDPRGEDIRTAEVPVDAVFVLTDHIPLPRKTAKSLVRQGAVTVSLGPIMLHASQCVSIVQNELDRRYISQ